jgi:hypothetical protein
MTCSNAVRRVSQVGWRGSTLSAGADAIPEHLRVPDLLADWVD